MSDHIYKMLELTGPSETGIGDACARAIAKQSEAIKIGFTLE